MCGLIKKMLLTSEQIAKLVYAIWKDGNDWDVACMRAYEALYKSACTDSPSGLMKPSLQRLDLLYVGVVTAKAKVDELTKVVEKAVFMRYIETGSWEGANAEAYMAIRPLVSGGDFEAITKVTEASQAGWIDKIIIYRHSSRPRSPARLWPSGTASPPCPRG